MSATEISRTTLACRLLDAVTNSLRYLKDSPTGLNYRLKASPFSSYALRTIGPLRIEDRSKI